MVTMIVRIGPISANSGDPNPKKKDPRSSGIMKTSCSMKLLHVSNTRNQARLRCEEKNPIHDINAN